jgi:uncharacterized membrane protein
MNRQAADYRTSDIARKQINMRLWLIPMIYVGAAVLCGLTLPHFEQVYLAAYESNISVASAHAVLSAIASGMMALTGIVFAMAFFLVQFSAIAYSPRLDVWFARDKLLYHALGIFTATFTFSLFTLAWVDRNASGTTPFFSTLLVGVLVISSMLLFSRLVHRLGDLQITNVLQLVGNKGRKVIHQTFQSLDDRLPRGWKRELSQAEQSALSKTARTIFYFGQPRTVTKLKIDALVRLAARCNATFVMSCAVGDTLIEGSAVVQVHGGSFVPRDKHLLGLVCLGTERTFEQDPKYPIRLLVDIAIKALSPGINDPTTAVQAIDQIEDLVRRLAGHDLDAGFACDTNGVLRVVMIMPTWEDYLALAFDEIRQYGASSLQVVRRLRAALSGVADAATIPARSEAIHRYVKHLDRIIERASLDAEDRAAAMEEDRQGLGLSRRSAEE